MDNGGLVSVYNERRNPKNLKPSMLNRIVHTEEGYNSARGTEGILRVSQESKPEVLEILSKKITNNGKILINELLKKGI